MTELSGCSILRDLGERSTATVQEVAQYIIGFWLSNAFLEKKRTYYLCSYAVADIIGRGGDDLAETPVKKRIWLRIEEGKKELFVAHFNHTNIRAWRLLNTPCHQQIWASSFCQTLFY